MMAVEGSRFNESRRNHKWRLCQGRRAVDVKEESGSNQRRSARLSGSKPEDSPSIIGSEARSKKRKDRLEVVVEQGLKRRKSERRRKEAEDAPVQVFRIHVSAGGE